METAYNVSLKLIHNDGVIQSARLLKGRSALPQDILCSLNRVLNSSFGMPKEEPKSIVALDMSKEEPKSIVALGNLGEKVVASHLRAISGCNSEFFVIDTSSNKGHGDLMVEYNQARICIEVKNYTKPIPGKEIDKYHRSLALPDYNMGILFSMNHHGFAREYKIKSPIDIRMTNGKPSAYISGIGPEILYPVITILSSMSHTEYDDELQEKLEVKTKALIQLNERIKELRTIIESQKKGISKMETMIAEMHAISLS